MTDKAPERIWRMNGTHGQRAYPSSVLDLPSDHSTFYVREDIHQALEEKTYKAGFDDGCSHIKEDYAAGDRIDSRRIKALEAERDHYANLYSKECDTYSVMHVRIVETEDERDRYASLLQDLLSRISGWEADNLSDKNCRDWMGHVEPVIARARAALEGKQ